MKSRRLPRARSSARAAASVAVALCLLLVVATTLPTLAYDPGRPASNTGKGGSLPPGSDDPDRVVSLGLARPESTLADVDAFSAEIGTTPAIWVIWSQWGHSGTRSFPTAMADQLRDRDITPMVWWEPVKPNDLSDPTYPRHKNIIDGDHDAYIRGWARDAKAYGGKVLVRFAHEANNNVFPWSINEFDNSPTTFKDAWRHVVDIFREEGATNVRWVWSIAKKICAGCNPYTQIYPGDAYVDVMAFSAYNWGAHPGKRWTSMYDSYRIVTNKLRQVSNKPIMAAETASNALGGDKPAWIRDGYREVYDRLPDVEAIVYLDADLREVGHPDWRLSSPAAAMTAYAEIAALPQFSGRQPFSARSVIKASASKKTAVKTRQATKRTKRAAAASPKGTTPVVRRGDVVDAKSEDSAVHSTAAKVTRPPKREKGDPEPVQVPDLFER